MSEVAGGFDIRKTISVAAEPERAFDVFTLGLGSWWPREYHIGTAEYETAIVEPFTGGRWYERGLDGSTCDWGRVLVWDPPRRVVLAWQISADWSYDPDLVTEIEVRFERLGVRQTRVTLEHRHLERYGRKAKEMFDIFSAGGVPGAPQGWSGILRAFGTQAEQREEDAFHD
jgi:uncharacterized protein YndB with AHSA1/START domain